MGGKTKRKGFAPEVSTATGGEIRRFLPSHVRADHSQNQRWQGYPVMPELEQYVGEGCALASDRVCFTAEQVEERLASLLKLGQIAEIKVSASNTGHPDLEIGYLRHLAFLLAEARGILDKIPGAKGTKVTGVRATVVKAAASQADHERLRQLNYAENDASKDLSPVDRAVYYKRRLSALRDDGKTMTRVDLAEEIGRKIDYVSRHLRLLTDLKPEELLAVHEGRLPMSRALKRASKRGSGSATGPRPTRKSIKHSNAARAVRLAPERPPPDGALSSSEAVQLIAIYSGTLDLSDTKTAPDPKSALGRKLQKWADWLDADKSQEPPKPPSAGGRKRKKAPPAPGEVKS